MKNTHQTHQIYDHFINTHGETQQLLQSVEEMSELTKEILKYIRYKDRYTSQTSLNNLKEELGDVYNALGSLVHILGIDMEEINEQRLNKLNNYYNNLKGLKDA